MSRRHPLSFVDRLVRSVALLFRRWGQSRQVEERDRVLRAARSIMRKKKYCTLATFDQDGSIDARVLQPFPVEEDLVVWLGTGPATRKVRQLRADNRATLVYQDDRARCCATLVGRIELVEDPERCRTHFRPSFHAFFPRGPEVDYLLLRFVPSRVQVWDVRRRQTPAPFGLRSAVVARVEGSWRLE